MYSDGYDEESITSTFQSHLKSIIAEYSLMRKMNGCSNIVSCDDVRYVQHDDRIGWDIFIKMELLTPLTKALPANIPEETVVKVAKDICSALELCKKFSVIHRDIKPQNILLSPNGDYKLGDFGIAKTVEKTMGGTKIGTYKYMAPEVYNNQPYGMSADIYSLGLVLYWMLNEKRMPFLPLPPVKLSTGMDEQARNRRLFGEQLPPPAHGSTKLKQIVLKACAYDPKERYQSAETMIADLNGLAGETAPICTVVPANDDNTVVQVDDLTTRSDFGSTQRQNDYSFGGQESDVTVGPVFGTITFTDKVGTQRTNDVSAGSNGIKAEQNKSSKYGKAIFIALAAVAVIIVVLLLRSCGSHPENSNHDDVPEETAGKQVSQQQGWSSWVDDLPVNFSAEEHEVESKTLYRSRMLEQTSSTTEKSMAGWELYNLVEANDGFGEWGDWIETEVTASDTREVETRTQYRYRDKETTTGDSSVKDGWTLYDTTYSWGNYGAWSNWSTSAVSNSDSRKVEMKTQYRYRDVPYATEYTGWESWSAWSFDRQSTSDLKKEESRTVWGYYYFVCPGCGVHMHGWGITCPTWAGGCGKMYIPESSWTQVYSAVSWDDAGLSDWYGTGKYYAYIDGQLVFEWSSGGTGTQYRYTSRSAQQVANYGSWSSWGDTEYSNSSSREAQSRTVYRYCDCSQIATYHFYRWASWSGWSANAVTATNTRQVETATQYRFRDQVKITTYYFQRWTEWTDYSETVITPSETVEVQIKTQYRYRSKDS